MIRAARFTILCALALAWLAGAAVQAGDSAWVRPATAYPETLSVNARYVLERYRAEPHPLAMVIAPDGGYATYWRCNGPDCELDDEFYVRKALDLCRERAHVGDCLVHSIRDRVIWPVRETFDTDIRSRLVVPWKHENAGPDEAKGAIVHVPGFAGHRYPPALDHPIAPYYLRKLNQQGYDTFRLNIAHFDYSRTDHVELGRKIRSTVRELRQRGYRKVFLNGQSRGAWEILSASRDSLGIDGAMLFVPAAHGRVTRWNGSLNRRFNSARDDFRDLIASAEPNRYLFAFFKGDEYDPGERVFTLWRQMHPEAVYFVLDSPEHLAGHGSGGRIAFHTIYGGCLEQFLEGRAVDFLLCPAAFRPEKDTDAATHDHLLTLGAERMTGDDLLQHLTDRAFFPAAGWGGWWGMHATSDGKLLEWFPGSYLTGNTLESTWQIDQDRFCIVGSPRQNRNHYCYVVFRMPSGNTGFIAPDGLAFVTQSTEATGPDQLPFRPGDWMALEAESGIETGSDAE